MLLADAHEEGVARSRVVAHGQGGIVDAGEFFVDPPLQAGHAIAIAPEEVREEAHVIDGSAGDSVEGILHPCRELEIHVVREVVAQEMGDAQPT